MQAGRSLAAKVARLGEAIISIFIVTKCGQEALHPHVIAVIPTAFKSQSKDLHLMRFALPS